VSAEHAVRENRRRVERRSNERANLFIESIAEIDLC